MVDVDDIGPCSTRLNGIPGVRSTVADSMIDVDYTGEVDDILKTLAEFRIQSIESMGGELHEVLLDFYSDDRYSPGGPR